MGGKHPKKGGKGPLPKGKRKASSPAESPAKRAKKERVRGEIRSTPCLGCLKSCLAGKQTDPGPNGACYDLDPKGGRCYKCSSGHSCKPIPFIALPAARKFLSGHDQKSVAIMNKWRPTVKNMLLLAKEGPQSGDDPNADVEGLTNEERKAEARSSALRLFECLWQNSVERPNGDPVLPGPAVTGSSDVGNGEGSSSANPTLVADDEEEDEEEEEEEEEEEGSDSDPDA